nr:hypothetical protein BaRGS_024188 [Batillaria attramentaria]
MQQRIQTFLNTCLRRIFNIQGPENIRKEELWERAGYYHHYYHNYYYHHYFYYYYYYYHFFCSYYYYYYYFFRYGYYCFYYFHGKANKHRKFKIDPAESFLWTQHLYAVFPM